MEHPRQHRDEQREVHPVWHGGARKLWRLRVFPYQEDSLDLGILFSRLPPGSAVALRPFALLFSRGFAAEQCDCSPEVGCMGVHEVLVALPECLVRRQVESWLEPPLALSPGGDVVDVWHGSVDTPRPSFLSDLEYWTLVCQQWAGGPFCLGSLAELASVLGEAAVEVLQQSRQDLRDTGLGSGGEPAVVDDALLSCGVAL
jgi:hypothetical protein